MKKYVAPTIVSFDIRSEERFATCIQLPSAAGSCPTGQDMCYQNQGS